MTSENYSYIKLTGRFKKANWQQLNDFLSRQFDPLNLRDFIGHAKNASIDEFARLHWRSDTDKKGFGDLMVLNAEGVWGGFKFKFSNSSDAKCYLELDVNAESKKILLKGSLDNKQKLRDLIRGVTNLFDSFKMTSSTDNGTTNIWEQIDETYDITKRKFGNKISFIKDDFKRKIIFRDVEQAYLLAEKGFNKPAVILAGSVIEELLRLYLDSKNIKPAKNTFDLYIKTCESNGLLKDAIRRLSDAVRQFRNLVHLAAEKSPRYTISKATAKGAVASIFTIANDLEF